MSGSVTCSGLWVKLLFTAFTGTRYGKANYMVTFRFAVRICLKASLHSCRRKCNLNPTLNGNCGTTTFRFMDEKSALPFLSLDGDCGCRPWSSRSKSSLAWSYGGVRGDARWLPPYSRIMWWDFTESLLMFWCTRDCNLAVESTASVRGTPQGFIGYAAWRHMAESWGFRNRERFVRVGAYWGDT